jgi:hypothetical protein
VSFVLCAAQLSAVGRAIRFNLLGEKAQKDFHHPSREKKKGNKIKYSMKSVTK